MAARADEQGFTLIELIVAMALFALISLAGLSLVQSVAGVQRGTEGRLDRLADLQRAMFVFSADFEQLRDGPTRRGDAVALVRAGGGRPSAIVYSLRDQALHRTVDGADRLLMDGVATIAWRFHAPGRGWTEQPTAPDRDIRPDAIELTLRLAPRAGGMRGLVRRLALLPAQPS